MTHYNERLRAMGCSPALSAAYDLLDDAGMADENRLTLCVAAERSGKCPEAFTRHLVKLPRAVREASPLHATATVVTPPALPARSVFAVGGAGETQAP